MWHQQHQQAQYCRRSSGNNVDIVITVLTLQQELAVGTASNRSNFLRLIIMARVVPFRFRPSTPQVLWALPTVGPRQGGVGEGSCLDFVGVFKFPSLNLHTCTGGLHEVQKGVYGGSSQHLCFSRLRAFFYSGLKDPQRQGSLIETLEAPKGHKSNLPSTVAPSDRSLTGATLRFKKSRKN